MSFGGEQKKPAKNSNPERYDGAWDPKILIEYQCDVPDRKNQDHEQNLRFKSKNHRSLCIMDTSILQVSFKFLVGL